MRQRYRQCWQEKKKPKCVGEEGDNTRVVDWAKDGLTDVAAADYPTGRAAGIVGDPRPRARSGEASSMPLKAELGGIKRNVALLRIQQGNRVALGVAGSQAASWEWLGVRE